MSTTVSNTYTPLALKATATTTDTANTSVNEDMKKKARDIGLIVGGAVIVLVQLVLYKYNAPLYSAFLSLYTLVFAVIVLIYIYKERSQSPDATSKTYFNIVSYISFYTIFLQLGLLALSIFAFIKLNNRPNYM